MEPRVVVGQNDSRHPVDASSNGFFFFLVRVDLRRTPPRSFREPCSYGNIIVTLIILIQSAGPTADRAAVVPRGYCRALSVLVFRSVYAKKDKVKAEKNLSVTI